MARPHTHRDYGVTYQNADKPVTQVHGGEAGARRQFPWLYKRADATKGAAWASSMYNGEAAHHEALWEGQNDVSGVPQHAVGLDVGDGKFLVTRPIEIGCGVYSGESSRFWDGTLAHSYGGTMYVMDRANWKDPSCRLLMRTSNWGVDGGNGAWQHHVRVQDMYFDCAAATSYKEDPATGAVTAIGTPWMTTDAPEEAGLGLWDGGEVSIVRDCFFVNSTKDGATAVRGTPVHFFNCSFFRTGRFGAGSIGSGKVELHGCSGDEQRVALVGSRAGYGRPGSSHISVFGGKHEVGTSGAFRPFSSSAMVDCEDWAIVELFGVEYSCGHVTPYCLIRMKTGVNSSYVNVQGLKLFNNAPKLLLFHERTPEPNKPLLHDEWHFPGGWEPAPARNENAFVTSVHDFVWDERHGMKSTFVEIRKTQRTVGGRLQQLGTDGATSWETAKTYDPTGGPGAVVPPPVTPPPVTPPPVEPPVTPPTGATVAHYKFDNGTANPLAATVGSNLQRVSGSSTIGQGKLIVSNGNTSYACNITGRTVTLTNFTPLTVSSGMMIMSTAANKGIVITQGGGIADNTGGSDRMLYPVGTLVAGKTVPSLVLTMLAATTFTRFGATKDAGNCFLGSLDELKVQG